jgi:hypothetical protein
MKIKRWPVALLLPIINLKKEMYQIYIYKEVIALSKLLNITKFDAGNLGINIYPFNTLFIQIYESQYL